VKGRRVEGGFGGLDQPGDYSPLFDDGKLSGVVFILPNGIWGRCSNIGFGQERDGQSEPEWTVTQESDGSITVSPSIETRTDPVTRTPETYWHGHLTRGEWT
jgi:hypothetical protein